MLHIITPLYRFDLLKKVYRTIPGHKDITWHVAKSTHREKLNADFIQVDPRICLYEIDCLDNDLVTKRNTVFAEIRDGYFCLLDDDTIFLPELYHVYQECNSEGFIGMIIGDQQTLGGARTLKASYPTDNPETTLIDAGMVICHFSVLKNVQWALSSTYRDRDFWSRCYGYFGKDSVRLVNKSISTYNYFGPKIRVRKRFFDVDIAFDIYNSRIAACYVGLGDYVSRIKSFLS